MLVVKEVKPLVPVIPVPKHARSSFPHKAGDQGERWIGMSPAIGAILRRENNSPRRIGEELQHTSYLPQLKIKRQFGVFITPKMASLRPEKKTKMYSLERGYWETQSSSALEPPLISSPWQWLS